MCVSMSLAHLQHSVARCEDRGPCLPPGDEVVVNTRRVVDLPPWRQSGPWGRVGESAEEKEDGRLWPLWCCDGGPAVLKDKSKVDGGIQETPRPNGIRTSGKV